MAVAGIAGAAQTMQRPGEWTDPADAKGAIELMVDAARAAADDGRRGWARSTDASLMSAAMAGELTGTGVRRASVGDFDV